MKTLTFKQRMSRMKKLTDLEGGIISFPSKMTRANARRVLSDLQSAEQAIERLLQQQ